MLRVKGVPRQAVPLIVLSSLLLLAVITAAAYFWRSTFEQQRLLQHTYNVLSANRALLADVRDAETGQRGYLLTQDESYLEPYGRGQSLAPLDYERLASLVREDAPERTTLRQLKELMGEKLKELALTLSVAKSAGFPAALAIVKTNFGRDKMESIRQLSTSIANQEQNTLVQRSAALTRILRIAIVSSAASVLLALLLFWSASVAILFACKRLWRSTERYGSLVKASSLNVWIADAGGSRDAESLQAWEKLTGQPFEEACHDGWVERVHPQDRDPALNAWHHSLTSRTPYDCEVRLRLVDQRHHWVQLRAIPMTREDGKLVEWIGTIDDVTDTREAELALERSEERLAFTAKAMGIGFYDRDWLTGTIQWTEPMKRIYGLAPEVSITPELVSSRLQCVDGEHIDAIANHLQHDAECQIKLEDGAVRWISSRAHVTTDLSGKPLRTIGVAQDVTERKLKDEALMRSEKLAAAGRLAATVAHEINNPLEAITNMLYIMGTDESMPSGLKHYIDEAQEQLQRVNRIANQSLRFYKDPTNPSFVSLGTEVQAATRFYKQSLRAKEIEVLIDDRSSEAMQGYVGELRQVLVNLLLNARDAAPQRGVIRCRVVNQHHPLTGRWGTRLTLLDRGMGITRGGLSRLFNPFFTTKGDAGTGLGLWTCRAIVEKHGGQIRVRSRTGGGSFTCFSVFFPHLASGDLLEGNA